MKKSFISTLIATAFVASASMHVFAANQNYVMRASIVGLTPTPSVETPEGPQVPVDGAWLNTGIPICSNWLPDLATTASLQDFLQTQDCQQPQERLLSNGNIEYREVDLVSSRNINVATETPVSIGIKNLSGNSNWAPMLFTPRLNDYTGLMSVNAVVGDQIEHVASGTEFFDNAVKYLLDEEILLEKKSSSSNPTSVKYITRLNSKTEPVLSGVSGCTNSLLINVNTATVIFEAEPAKSQGYIDKIDTCNVRTSETYNLEVIPDPRLGIAPTLTPRIGSTYTSTNVTKRVTITNRVVYGGVPVCGPSELETLSDDDLFQMVIGEDVKGTSVLQFNNSVYDNPQLLKSGHNLSFDRECVAESSHVDYTYKISPIAPAELSAFIPEETKSIRGVSSTGQKFTGGVESPLGASYQYIEKVVDAFNCTNMSPSAADYSEYESFNQTATCTVILDKTFTINSNFMAVPNVRRNILRSGIQETRTIQRNVQGTMPE